MKVLSEIVLLLDDESETCPGSY